MKHKELYILGIESSCDDTGAAVIKNSSILSNVIAGQKVHEEYGGVVPELASRAHQKNLIPVVDLALKKAGISIDDLDGIAYTRGPGLMGSLVVGTSFAKALSLAKNIPLLDVHHMQAHVLAHFIDDGDKTKPPFPFLCLTVSGGHTQIVLVQTPLMMEVIGQTIDDAAGEAFDKSAKLLGFPYPGGPLIDRHAKTGNPLKFSFAEPKVQGYDFSFSGLKTSILYFLQKEVRQNPNFIDENLDDLCASIQNTIVQVLIKKIRQASRDLKINHIAIAGGVSANSGLRSALEKLMAEEDFQVYLPRFEYCTDNAAMIAIAGKFMFESGLFSNQSASATPRWSM